MPRSSNPTGHATDLFSDWAVDYLRERAKRRMQPFFLYLAYNAPHFPIEPPAEWLAKVKATRAAGTRNARRTSPSSSISTITSGACSPR
jgi:arylsulfatase A-like enzyme